MALATAPSSPPQLLPSKTINTQNASSFDHHGRILLALKQCTNMSSLKQIHAQTLRSASPHHPKTLFLYSQILLLSSSLDFNYALLLFNQVENPNSFMWNTLIRACALNVNNKEQAIRLYQEMLEQALVFPDKHTFPFVLKGCAYLFAFSEGKQVHAHALKHRFGSDVYVNNSLIHLYASCGCLDLAEKVFVKMSGRSLVSWNVLIEGFAQFGKFNTALELFREMQNRFDPDGYTLQSVISACAGLGALSLGAWAHAYLLNKCDFDLCSDVLINNSLVDMYCKCGSLELAQQVFERMPRRDLTSWNHMILGFAMHGQADEAIGCFDKMIRTESFRPNSITFVGVLSACNHKGMVFKGREFFDLMINDYEIKPGLEHYGCLVDLLARAGFIDDALDIVSTMPMRPDAVIWRSLLDACCKKNGSVELSEELANQVLESEGDIGSGVFVLLSRVYASASRWDDVGLVRKLMTDKGVTKEPGCSSLEIDGVAHELFAGDTCHPQTKEIYQMLNVIDEKLASVGYSPDHSQAPMVDELDETRQHSLRLHSERIAIALGLLKLQPGMPIRIFKNLRVCNDCHEVTKLISRIFKVEIFVRDRARFHHFKDGSCSCLDYW
ncbi:PREDICTED: pentatricopeptide repeat-containing protein At1g59720, chloroplastic/mitochondrial [Theobroma cacao]|uniref:Pentatricopeptide repeat-containing protein At1g59720, chloroplastic/mitochondrial n=1 Tax=Theobroma cacao TaxID=3641 RepID=A0AB32VKK9_THECC|nr:PREDICTED: pentatricopeptide repeat-containing protein At1g59720, chloroplastic/mitochondrial [Theobroma cacao]